MKMAVIGATGTVGRAVYAELAKRHEMSRSAPRAARIAST